jgi:transcriptional regulator with XRE-family HTH domain
MHTTAKVDTRWFQDRLTDKRMSQRKLATMIGIDPGALSLALHGKRKFTVDEVSEIARLLNVEC